MLESYSLSRDSMFPLMILVRIILLAEMFLWSRKDYLRLKKKIST